MCCGFAGKYVSGTDVLVCFIEKRKGKNEDTTMTSEKRDLRAGSFTSE
jgi:hypothetical protein